jgi:5-methylcytosine-specific restriction endonuclease McrA
MEDLKCQHCGSVNLDLDHIFPSCLECYHFLPNITRKAAINARSDEYEDRYYVDY